MLKLRLKNTSQALIFETLSFGLKGKLISVYDQYNPVTKFVVNNIFDITITEKIENEVENKEQKKIKVSVKLNNSTQPICFDDVVQTDSNEYFYIVNIEKEGEKITRYFPLDDIFSVKENY